MPPFGQAVVERAVAAKHFDGTAAHQKPIGRRLPKINDGAARLEVAHIHRFGHPVERFFRQRRQRRLPLQELQDFQLFVLHGQLLA